MKKIFIALMFFVSTAAHADSTADTCAMTGLWANVIMKARQAGVPLTQTMGIFKGTDLTADLQRGLALTAYKIPRFESKAARDLATSEFENAMVLECYKTLAK